MRVAVSVVLCVVVVVRVVVDVVVVAVLVAIVVLRLYSCSVPVTVVVRNDRRIPDHRGPRMVRSRSGLGTSHWNMVVCNCVCVSFVDVVFVG